MKACKKCGAPCKRNYCDTHRDLARSDSTKAVQLAHAQALRDYRKANPGFMFDKGGERKSLEPTDREVTANYNRTIGCYRNL